MKNEVVVVDKLAVIVKESGLSTPRAQVMLETFSGHFQMVAEWEIKARAIKVTNASQKAEMQMAKTGRLFLKKQRNAIENIRKELKEQPLRESKAIDGISNVLKSVIIPLEKYLEKQEKFVEIKAAEIAEVARIEIEEKAEKDRIEKEEEEKKEQERIRGENEKLRKEVEAREKKLQDEREKARREKAEIERKARIEKDKQDKILADQKAKAEKEKKEIEKNTKKKMADYVTKAEQEKADRVAKAMEAEKEQQAKLEAERDELARLRTWVKEQVECPYCHKKFSLKNEFKICIYCSSPNIDYNKNNDDLWNCNYCGRSWDN